MAETATILPETNRVIVNESIFLAIKEYDPDRNNNQIFWSVDNSSIASLLNSSTGSPTLIGNSTGIVKLSVEYSYTTTDSEGEETLHEFSASRNIAVTWAGLSFGSLQPSDIFPIPSPSFIQNPLNLQITNLRAKVAPCLYWTGSPREYVVRQGYDIGTELGENLKEYYTKVGYIITDEDKHFDPSITEPVGTVVGVRDLQTKCSKAEAELWRNPPLVSAFLPCNGAKPFKIRGDDQAGSLGRCPYYTNEKTFKHLFDDALGFKKSGYTPKIAATHIQEIRMFSEDTWDIFDNPLEEFNSRFEDPEIWAWSGYYTNAQGVEDRKILKVKKVHVNDSITDIIIGEEFLLNTGTPTSDGLPNYPTLIKELQDFNTVRIDFPKRPVENPFVFRNFTENQNYVNIYGHTTRGRKTVYCINITYAERRMLELGIVPLVRDGLDLESGGLTNEQYIDFIRANVPDALYTTTSDYTGKFVFGYTYDVNGNGGIDADNRIKLVYSTNEDIVANKIRVFLNKVDATDGSMYTDTTFIKCRFLHGWVYQTGFIGDCDNSDSMFESFSATVDVQLATGFESIGSFLIASPDLGGIYAAWKSSDLESSTGMGQSYYLYKMERIVDVPREDITILYSRDEYIVRVADLSASRLSYWSIKDISLAGEGNSNIKFNIVKHDVELDNKFELEGDDYKGVSFRNGVAAPANYLHIVLDKDTLTPEQILDLANISLSITFDYFEHRDMYSFPQNDVVNDLYRSPHNVNESIRLDSSGYSISPLSSISVDDGLSQFYSYDDEGNLAGRDIPIQEVKFRTYTITGADIDYRIRYFVLFTDEEGRFIGRKQSAILFGVSVPTCADIEISYAWSSTYTSERLLPINTRFCNWGGGTPCYPYSYVNCDGAPSIWLRPPGRQNLISKVCFDHGETLDRVWWPFNTCEIPHYKQTSSFGEFFELIPTPFANNWSYKYLAGYSYFSDQIASDSGAFFNCFFGLKYINHKALEPATWGDWRGGTIIRSGDLRGDITEGSSGHKGPGIWLWGTDRERKILYAGMDKVMNFMDLNNGYSSIYGTQGIDGKAFMTEPAGVDLNGIATEDFIHPFNQFLSSNLGGFRTMERYATDYFDNESSQNQSLRKCGRYWLTGITGDEEDWRWPIIQWMFDNAAHSSVECYDEEAPAYRGEQVDGHQTAWVYLEKTVKPIERSFYDYIALANADPNYSALVNLTLRAINFSYPEDYEDSISPPLLFIGLPDEKFYVVSYRPEEGQYEAVFRKPRYNSNGVSIEYAKIWLQNIESEEIGPYRNILGDGTFEQDQEPYDSSMPLHAGINVNKFLASDSQNVKDSTAPGIADVPNVGNVNAKRRGLVARTPIDYSNLPYRVLDVVDKVSSENFDDSILPIKSTYEYSRNLVGGNDYTPLNLTLFVIGQAARLTGNGTSGNHSAILDTASFDVLFKLSHMADEGDFRKLWQPYIEKVTVQVYVGRFQLDFQERTSIAPRLKLYTRTLGDSSFLLVDDVNPNSSDIPSDGYYTITVDNINTNAKELKFSFSVPTGTSDNYVVLSNVSIYGRVLQDSREAITTYDKMYVPSVMLKDDGYSGIQTLAGSCISIAGLDKTQGQGNTTTLSQDSYKGDARRDIPSNVMAIKRPIIPNADLDSPIAGVFKSGRVVMDVTRSDKSLKSSRARDTGLCEGTTRLGRTFPQGSIGPGECIQEGIYELARNFISDPTLEYEYFMEPNEERFFIQELNVSQNIMPNVLKKKLSIFVQEPKTLQDFRGDNSENYTMDSPWIDPGHAIINESTGNCWCYVGNIKQICGMTSAPCCDRFLVHWHKDETGNAKEFISDLGHVIRRFTNVLGYAFFLTFSNGLLLHWPELVGQPYITPKERDIFSNISPTTNRRISISGDWVVPLGHPFFHWYGGTPSLAGGYYY